MQMLHPFFGSIQQYCQQLEDPNRYRPHSCPQCRAKKALTAHGFYCRTIVDRYFDGVIRVRRYLCCFCRRTVSLLPEFVLPYMRFTVVTIGLFLIARLRDGNSDRCSICVWSAWDAIPARPTMDSPIPESGKRSCRSACVIDEACSSQRFCFQISWHD
jgi:hypothetical protein